MQSQMGLALEKAGDHSGKYQLDKNLLWPVLYLQLQQPAGLFTTSSSRACPERTGLTKENPRFHLADSTHPVPQVQAPQRGSWTISM